MSLHIALSQIPQNVSAERLRKDLGDIIKSHGGRLDLSSRQNASPFQESYEISERGTVIVLTDDSMRIPYNGSRTTAIGVGTAIPSEIQAYLALSGFDEKTKAFQLLYFELMTVHKRYH